MNLDDEIPIGWRLASVQDVREHETEAHAAINITLWGIFALSDGEIHGPGYNFKINEGADEGRQGGLFMKKESGMPLIKMM